eukprot:CAMPEP_0184487280 /NCGR_PEP_ID=MMETSP0113_2-20130426/9670_1 /TAXON_ID=91329 /ORGANISM="Norrisiella sphaerica, Strain BC52" /LENGTH=427 /DNA_ID=CAMNT_0026869525 /DNA_START=44 /DNA_END=1327 /DNA_ORIENTATION=+
MFVPLIMVAASGFAAAHWKKEGFYALEASGLETTNGPSGEQALMIMKGTRTASTYFCDELNQRGVHVSQEALGHWPQDAERLNVTAAEHMTAEGRRSWIEASLRYRMPRNPFAIEVSCRNNFGRKGWDWKKRDQCSQLSSIQGSPCKPPYTMATCRDEFGCFNQLSNQPKCFTVKPGTTGVFGVSFDYRETLALGDVDKVDWDELVRRRIVVYKDIVSKISKERSLTVLAQTRTNFVRWAISMAFHKEAWGEPDSSYRVVDDGKEKKIIANDPVQMVKDMVYDAYNQLTMVREVSPEAKTVFYEDIAKDADTVIKELLPSTTFINKQNKDMGDPNVAEQHSEEVNQYFTNFKHFENAIKPYPCFYKQVLSTDKHKKWTLPLAKETNANGDETYVLDLNASCETIEDDRTVYSIQEYLDMSYKASTKN